MKPTKMVTDVCSGVIVAFIAVCGAAAQPGPSGCFEDHGIAAPVSENRSMNTGRLADGRPFILAIESSGSGSSLLMIDAESGETTQHFYPNRKEPEGGVFTRLLASSGKYYLVLGDTFVEFDPDTREWSFEEAIEPNSLAMSFAEAPDGTIYFATYPRSELYRFDPRKRDVELITQIDPTEKYPYYMGVDDQGWIYIGLGTIHSTVRAYHPERDEHRLINETTIRSGEGTAVGAIPEVFRGGDGDVYGEAWPGGPWLRLRGGEAAQIDRDDVPNPTPHRSEKFTVQMPHLPGGGEIRDFDLISRSFTLVRADNSSIKVRFDYESRGAGITRLVEGPDGAVWGGTAHPLQVFRYQPGTGAMTNLGGLEKIGGGNFPAYTVVDGKIYGAAYLGGHFYEIDPDRPWTRGEGVDPNPRLLHSYSKHIARPRIAKHHDGKIILGGFPGYGDVGGGLAFYDLKSNETTMLTNDQLVRGQSTVAIRVLPNGDLVAGTSIAAPGGGQEIAETAALYVLDAETMEVTSATHPVEGAREIPAVELGDEGTVFGLTGSGVLFVIDLDTKSIRQKKDLGAYGRAVRTDQSLRMWNGLLVVLLSDTVLLLKPDTLSIEHVAATPAPVRAGVALVGDRLYYASGARVMSYDLAGCTQ